MGISGIIGKMQTPGNYPLVYFLDWSYVLDWLHYVILQHIPLLNAYN